MYSGSYKHRPGTVTAFEDAYAKEDFLRRSATAKNSNGCTPYSEKSCIHDEEIKNIRTDQKNVSVSVSHCEKEPPLLTDKPKKAVSDLLSGIDGGDILLILLILFFLWDKDPENDGLIPVLLALVLLF